MGKSAKNLAQYQQQLKSKTTISNSERANSASKKKATAKKKATRKPLHHQQHQLTPQQYAYLMQQQ